jgi:hypothetical protein
MYKEEFIKRMAQAGQRQAGTERRSTVNYSDLCMSSCQLRPAHLLHDLSIDDTAISRVHVSARYAMVSQFVACRSETDIHDRHNPSPDIID